MRNDLPIIGLVDLSLLLFYVRKYVDLDKLCAIDSAFSDFSLEGEEAAAQVSSTPPRPSTPCIGNLAVWNNDIGYNYSQELRME